MTRPARWLVLLLVGVALGACESRTGVPDAATSSDSAMVANLAAPEGRKYLGRADGKLHVWFFDVGQGDALLVRGPSGKSVLIDGGPEEAASYLSHRLPDLIEGPLDAVVVTTAHPDHYGSLSQVLQVVGLQRFLAPTKADRSAPEGYRQLLQFLTSHAVPVFQAASPETGRAGPLHMDLGGEAALEVLAEDGSAEGGLAVRITWGRTSLLVVGDAMAGDEDRLLERTAHVQSTLLKVGAHGAHDAAQSALLRAVQPSAAIISVGAGNERSAPSRQTLLRLAAAGVTVFRTDLDGEIHAVSNGETFRVVTERPVAGDPAGITHLFTSTATGSAAATPPPTRGEAASRRSTDDTAARSGEASAPYVASRHSEVFHVPDCRAARRIKEKNLLVFATREEAAKDRRPAGDCHP